MAHFLSQTRIEHPIWLETHDISFLRSRMSKIRAEIKSLETDFGKGWKNKLVLKRQIGVKIKEIAAVRNILSPIRRLPQKILAEIFVFSCEPKIHINAAYWHIRTLCCVCFAWQMTAHADPRLWSELDLAFEHDRYPRNSLWIRDWLDRSRGLPLDIALRLFYNSLRHRAQRQLLDRVLDFHHQIRVLCLKGYSSLILPPLSRLPQSSLPLLETLFLCIQMPMVAEAQPIILQTFLGAPNLRYVEIGDERCDASVLTDLALPLEQLTSLRIHVHDSDTASTQAACADIRDRCKNVRFLSHHHDCGIARMLLITRLLDVLQSRH